jgi:glycosyltransferase involved in cell wall biosynthesis
LATDIPDDYFLIVSRLEPYKKIDLAIKAFNKMKRPLVIIGEGSAKEELKSIASKQIEFLGWQSDASVYEYMRNCRGLIFPGEEDYGLTPVEAMAAGRPVVAYRKGGVTETVVEEKTGVFFNDPSPDSLIKAIDRLDDIYLEISADVCRERAERFSQENFLKEMNQFITSQYKKFKEENE